MLRTSAIFVGLVMLFGAAVAMAAWPRVAPLSDEGFASTGQLLAAYARVGAGTPASGLDRLGFDIGKAEKLSALGLMEHFMPKDSFAFDALDPAVQGCFQGRDDCVAYIFHVARSPAQTVLLVEGGRMEWKSLSGVDAGPQGKARLARRD